MQCSIGVAFIFACSPGSALAIASMGVNIGTGVDKMFSHVDTISQNSSYFRRSVLDKTMSVLVEENVLELGGQGLLAYKQSNSLELAITLFGE